MDLDFSLWNVLNYGFVALNRYRATEIFYFFLRQFFKLRLQGLCPCHACCRIYQYKVHHTYPSFNIFRVCTKVPSLIPILVICLFSLFLGHSIEVIDFFKEPVLIDFFLLFVHFRFHLFPLFSLFFLLLTLDLICSSSFLR